jgi:hypothetical protein
MKHTRLSPFKISIEKRVFLFHQTPDREPVVDAMFGV